jgi:hypothetical protein
MFELLNDRARCLAWWGSLSRLDRALGLMFIDPTRHVFASKQTQFREAALSNFIVPNR